jgi:hypothetical protein
MKKQRKREQEDRLRTIEFHVRILEEKMALQIRRLDLAFEGLNQMPAWMEKQTNRLHVLERKTETIRAIAAASYLKKEPLSPLRKSPKSQTERTPSAKSKSGRGS